MQMDEVTQQNAALVEEAAAAARAMQEQALELQRQMRFFQLGGAPSDAQAPVAAPESARVVELPRKAVARAAEPAPRRAAAAGAWTEF
jgi:methyl-accepting chemotaxis protein